MNESLLECAVADNSLFFSETGFAQTILLKQAENELEILGIFSRVENIEDTMNPMKFEQYQSQITFPTKDIPSWFSRRTKILAEDSGGGKHEYFMEKSQTDDMLGRMHVWLKKIGKLEIPV